MASHQYLIADADGQEARLRSGASPASAGQRWGAEPPERWGHLLRGDTAEPVPSARGAWDLFYPAFAAAIRGTQPVPADPGTPSRPPPCWTPPGPAHAPAR